MPWPFIGRAEQIADIRAAIASSCGGPLVLTGAPRIGRTSVLRAALAHIDERHTSIVHLGPMGGRTPFAALANVLPADLGARPGVEDITRALIAGARGRRLVVVADDAHLADQASMLVVRELHRRAGALLLISQPQGGAGTGRPDPLDCLRHEPGLRMLHLPPLRVDEVGAIAEGLLGGPVRPATVAALHAATEGNPGLLHDLLLDGGLAELLERTDGGWQLRRVPAGLTAEPGADTLTRLREAARAAWRDLELDRADELCRLASWSGLGAEVAPMWAGVLLLTGRPEDGLDVLDAFPADPRRTVLVRALLLALGHGRVDEALAVLTEAARAGATGSGCLLAKRAWLLAITGRTAAAEEALAGAEPRADREAYVYTLAARATLAMAAAEPNAAVAHLRRALLGAKAWQHELPWLAPYLTANLIDALLLSGRITEATTAAADFHAGQHGCGWRIAVRMADLTAHAGGASVGQSW